jgi:hypothetical protein
VVENRSLSPAPSVLERRRSDSSAPTLSFRCRSIRASSVGEWHSDLPFLLFLPLSGRCVPVLMEQFVARATCFVSFGVYFASFSSQFWIVAFVLALDERDSTLDLSFRNGNLPRSLDQSTAQCQFRNKKANFSFRNG